MGSPEGPGAGQRPTDRLQRHRDLPRAIEPASAPNGWRNRSDAAIKLDEAASARRTSSPTNCRCPWPGRRRQLSPHAAIQRPTSNHRCQTLLRVGIGDEGATRRTAAVILSSSSTAEFLTSCHFRTLGPCCGLWLNLEPPIQVEESSHVFFASSACSIPRPVLPSPCLLGEAPTSTARQRIFRPLLLSDGCGGV